MCLITDRYFFSVNISAIEHLVQMNISNKNMFKWTIMFLKKYFLQKILGFSSLMCVFLFLNSRDNPI